MLRSVTRTLQLAVAATLFFGSAATAQTLTLATDAAGSTYNAVGSGFAKVITEGSPLRISVRPYAGPDAYIDQLNNGELNLATMSSSSAYLLYKGDTRAKKENKNIRVLRAGEGGLLVGFIALNDSGIKTIADLKGKRVASDFGGHAVIGKSVEGALATAGLTWKDVRPVPVTGANDGPQALGAGRVDASWSSLGQPVVREIHTQKPVRILDTDNTPETVKLLRDRIFPGINIVKVKKNPEIGVQDDINMISYDAYLIGNKDIPNDQVKKILQAVWDKTDELTQIHRGLSGFTKAAAATQAPVIPYHPAAIEFYKEKGVWTPAVDKANAQLVK